MLLLEKLPNIHLTFRMGESEVLWPLSTWQGFELSVGLAQFLVQLSSPHPGLQSIIVASAASSAPVILLRHPRL